VAGRLSSTAALGECLEFREKWLHSALIIAAWIAPLAWFARDAVNAATTTSCNAWTCVTVGADANRNGALSLAALCAAAIACLLWRRLGRTPLIRVGDLGLEDGTAILGRRTVSWGDVVAIGHGRRQLLVWKLVDVQLDPERFPRGERLLRVRVSGLDEAPAEIEAEMRSCLARFHRSAWHRRHASTEEISSGADRTS
jgi:hypothetical protein